MYEWNEAQDAERFVQSYADLILRIALSHGLTRQDAQDIVQEIFLKLLVGRRRFRDGEHERAWIIRAAANTCKNLLRSARWRRTAPLDAAETVPADAQETGVWDALRALPERDRQVVSLHCVEGYSMDETARLLGISPPAARKRLERARKRLKTELNSQ